jgi:hypothetical protein
MSAVLTRHRRTDRGRERDAYRQPSLFAQVVAPPPLDVPAANPEASPDEEIRELATTEVRTLDVSISALWDELLAGDSAACPVCGDDLEPQHSGAGSSVIGGRCGTCSATLA